MLNEDYVKYECFNCNMETVVKANDKAEYCSNCGTKCLEEKKGIYQLESV